MDCAAKCSTNPACEYFVYGPKEKQCWLKRDFIYTMNNNDRIAGPRCYVPARCTTSMFQPNINWRGNVGAEDVQEITTGVENAMDCAARCGNNPKCEYFVF